MDSIFRFQNREPRPSNVENVTFRKKMVMGRSSQLLADIPDPPQVSADRISDGEAVVADARMPKCQSQNVHWQAVTLGGRHLDMTV